MRAGALAAVRWLAATTGRWWCGVWHGHDAVLRFEGGYMRMVCTSCGHETPGWDCRGKGATG